MKTAANTLLVLRHPGRPEALPVLLALVSCLALVGTYALGMQLRAERADAVVAPVLAPPVTAHAEAAPATAPPTAAEFEVVLTQTSNAFATDHGRRVRLTKAHCVSPKPGYYMCSYVATAPGGRGECHLMQGRWTPATPSSFTVTLAGRTVRCGSVREAVRSLR